MSFDFFANEERANQIRVMSHPSLAPEPGIFDNFVAGSAKSTMLGFAQTARSIDLLGAVGPIVQDKLTGGTTEQDKYFKEHDDVFNRAVDYLTPNAGEVGTAGRVVGSLVSGLATVVTSPGLAVGGTQLATGEDLVRKGVDSGKAMAAGAVAGTGLGLGIYMPILGNSLASRVILGGAAGNIAQGVAVRGINQAVLKDTPGQHDFNPWDKESLILDGLMGAAFGTLAHLTAPEKAAIDKALTPSDKDAILTANQARHVEDTTAPGRPVTDTDLTAHAEAMRNAVNDLLNGRAANVEQAMQGVKFANDAQKVSAQQEVMASVKEEAAQISKPEGDIQPPEPPPVEKVEKATPPKEGETAKPLDPIIAEAQARIAANPDLVAHIGTDAEGKPITKPIAEVMKAASDDVAKAKSESNLFAEAARCLLGAL